MSSLVHDCLSCMRTRQRPWFSFPRQYNRLPFSSAVNNSFKRDAIPSQLKDLLIYIARDGVLVADLFRRPGNPTDMRSIIQCLQEGKSIDWRQYSFFTLANVAKKFLINVKDGILGLDIEQSLIQTLDIEDDQMRIESMHNILMQLPLATQQLLALLFGIWFRMIYHTNVNIMSVEAVAKSVAGSVFPTCTVSPEQVELASKVMEHFITGFASPELFGSELIEYFIQETRTSLSRTERYIYECERVPFLPKEEFQELFTRMLQEEARKHNFDINKHEVSTSEFESSKTIDNSTHCEVHQTSEVLTHMTLSQNLEDSECETHLTKWASSNAQMSTPSHCLNMEKSNESLIQRGSTSKEDCFQGNAKTPYTSVPIPPSSCIPSFHTNSIRRRQQARMEKRSAWFLSVPGGSSSNNGSIPEGLISSVISLGPDSVSFHPMRGSSIMRRNPESQSSTTIRPKHSSQVEIRYFIVERIYRYDERAQRRSDDMETSKVP